MDLATSYLGLALRNPLAVAASPLQAANGARCPW
jgi:hypothetical protein